MLAWPWSVEGEPRPHLGRGRGGAVKEEGRTAAPPAGCTPPYRVRQGNELVSCTMSILLAGEHAASCRRRRRAAAAVSRRWPTRGPGCSWSPPSLRKLPADVTDRPPRRRPAQRSSGDVWGPPGAAVQNKSMPHRLTKRCFPCESTAGCRGSGCGAAHHSRTLCVLGGAFWTLRWPHNIDLQAYNAADRVPRCTA